MNHSVRAVTAGGESDSASQLRCLGFPAERPLRPGTVMLRAKSMLERMKIAHRKQQRTAIVIERLAATAGLVTFFIVGYFGVGRSISSAMTFDMATSLDRRIPFIAQSVWIYFWVFTAALIPLFVVKCPRLFRRTVLAYGLVIAISLICFKAYPATSASLRAAGAVLDVSSPSNWAVSVLYSLDPPYNLFPSLHLSLALLAAFSAWKAKRLLRSGSWRGSWLGRGGRLHRQAARPGRRPRRRRSGVPIGRIDYRHLPRKTRRHAGLWLARARTLCRLTCPRLRRYLRGIPMRCVSLSMSAGPRRRQ